MYLDETVTKKHAIKALSLLKYMRTSTKSFDMLVEDSRWDIKARHVAEECLRAAAREPLTRVKDREGTITQAIKLCVRLT